MTGKREFSTTFRALSADESARVLWGVCYYADKPDSWDEYLSRDALRRIAYDFAAKHRSIDIGHIGVPIGGLEVVESEVVREGRGFTVTDDSGNVIEQVHPGDWLLSVRVSNDKVWDMVKEGRFKAFSWAGVVIP